MIAVVADLDTASYVNSVAVGADWLLRRLDTPGAGQAVESLKERARHGLEDFEPTSEPAMPDLDSLDQAMARLAVAGTLLAADRAIEPGAGAEAHTAFKESVTRLNEVGHELDALAQAPVSGFAAVVPASPNAEVAARLLRRQANDALAAVVDEATEIMRSVHDKIICRYQQVVQDALDAVGAKVEMSDWAGELATLARHLIEWVLDRLSRLLPPGLLCRTRDRARQLLEAPDLRSAVAVVLGVADTTAAIGTCLARPGLDRASLDVGTAELSTLADRYGSKMRWARRSVGAIALLPAVLPVPNAALVVPVLFLTVLCAVVVISIDYVDSGHGLGLIRGVGSVVAEACGETP